MVNLLKISLANLRHKSGSTIISILMMGIGLAIITSISLIRTSITSRMQKNIAGVDLVVGAKGSPTQLILSSLFHIDYPTGNISYHEALNLKNNPMVKTWIPLSLGDNYHGYRIVGSNTGLLDLYNAQLSTGSSFTEPLQVVAGAEVARKLGLHPGETFFSAHGLQKGDHVHQEHALQIVGILQPAGSVVDELLITSLESVWLLHNNHHHENSKHPEEDGGHHGQRNGIVHGHEHEEHDHKGQFHDVHEHETKADAHDHDDGKKENENFIDKDHEMAEQGLEEDEGAQKEITSVILQFTNPMGAIQMPQYINEFTNMQAASPAFEIARIFSLLGVGITVLAWIAMVLILLALISLVMVLYTNLNQHVYDLVLLRVMGARPAFLFKQVTLQGLIITLSGGLLAFLLVLAGLFFLKFQLSQSLVSISFAALSGTLAVILAMSFILGLLVALIPAIKAYRLNISTTLAKA